MSRSSPVRRSRPGSAPSGASPHHRGSEPPRPFVLRVGLTGGIATGKTTVGKIFTELGATVLDADAIAHRLLDRGARGYGPVVREFGRDILRPDNSVDRSVLGKIVFADTARRRRLEAILHPLIKEEESTRVGRLTARGERIFVSNAALLVETGHYREYHRLIVVHCDASIQIQRIVSRDRLSEDEARARIASQMDTAAKLAAAHYAIDTGPGFAETESRARAVFRHLQFDLQALSRRA